MKGVKQLKSRLKSVGNIKKITKAMEMVAATKLRRLQERALATRPYAARIEEMIARVAAHADPAASPLLMVPDTVEAEAILVVAGDRGLCGSYNSNVFRAVRGHLLTLESEGVTPHMYIFGARAGAFLGRTRGVQIDFVHPDPLEKIDIRQVQLVARRISDAFIDGGIQRARVLYTRMRSIASFTPDVRALLPIPRLEPEAEGAESLDYILEPDPESLMRALLPRFLEMQIYAAILESLASEFASRRIAMKSATDNADEMVGILTMEYNKARQAGITGDLLDIVGGAEAVRG